MNELKAIVPLGRLPACALALLLLACGGPESATAPRTPVASKPPAPAAPSQAAADPGLLRIGDWIVTCLPGDAGAADPDARMDHCRVEKRGFAAVARVDARGPMIVTSRPATVTCSNYARFAGVDGRAIQDLLHAQKLGAMQNGATFAREYQGPEPPCGIRIETTGLARFGEAYEAMISRWERFGT